MQLKAAEDVVKWLHRSWMGNVDWDEHNIGKLSKHGFSRTEVEEALADDFVFAGEVVGEFGERRFVLFGKISDGRHMTIAWTMRRNKLRPISCRRSRDAEKKRFEQCR